MDDDEPIRVRVDAHGGPVDLPAGRHVLSVALDIPLPPGAYVTANECPVTVRHVEP